MSAFRLAVSSICEGATTHVKVLMGYTPAPCIHDRDFEVTADFDGVAHSRSDTFEAGLDKFAVSISNPAVAQMVLKGVDEFNIPDGAALLFYQFGYTVVPVCPQSYRPFRSQTCTNLGLPLGTGLREIVRPGIAGATALRAMNDENINMSELARVSGWDSAAPTGD